MFRVSCPATAALGLILSGGLLQAAGYEPSVLADGPLLYLPMGVEPEREAVANNLGTAEELAPNGTHVGVTHGWFGALQGTPNNRAVLYENGGRTVVPHSAAVNPAASESFTIEFWVTPYREDATGGSSPVFNREQAEGGNPRGWAFYQGAGESPGLNFEMYDGTTGTPSVALSGGTTALFQWSHVAVTWQGDTGTATLYVNGAQVATTSGASFAPAVGAALGLGGAPAGGGNAFEGGVDEFAFYPAALSAGEISQHFTTGSSLEPVDSYTELVKAKTPALFLRQDEPAPTLAVTRNLGSVGAEANGYHFPGLKHQVAGALAGDENPAAGYHLTDKANSEVSCATSIPFHPELNTEVFSIEAWLRPTLAGNGNAQCPLYNHDPGDGRRSGWVLWQRSPSAGWNFRAYNEAESGSARTAIDAEFGPYTLGEWQHLVVTFDGSQALCYINGQLVQSKPVNGTYNPNRFNPSSATLIQPGIGGFPNGWENGFEGDIDEVAFYGSVLTEAQVQEHYANGTNPNRAVPYEELILSHAPTGYYRLDEAAKGVQQNLGTLGDAANGTFVNGPATVPAPANGGFSSSDAGSLFDGRLTYVELNNPAGLNIAGPITLEAWVRPDTEQLNFANNIIGHGQAEGGQEVFLRIEDGKYEVGANGGKASFAAPAEDLTGETWVHLAGTWDGTRWTLYRNGQKVAEGEPSIGPAAINTANWAIGARGRWVRAGGYPNAPENAARIFSGAILGAAIFDKALTQEQVEAHYAAQLAMMSIEITRPDGVLTLTWNGGILQKSENLIDWEDVTENGTPVTSPYLPDDGPRQFYRVREAD